MCPFFARSGTQSLDSARSEKSNVTTTTTSGVSSRHTEFTQRMEERAATRAKLKQEREEKKRKAEAEKLVRISRHVSMCYSTCVT